EVVERGRQREQADRQQARKKMQVGDAQPDAGDGRHLAQHHGVKPWTVEVEEPLPPRDLHQERRADHEEAPAFPAVPERQPPDEAERRRVGDYLGWHAQACGLYRTPGNDASGHGLQRRKGAVSKACMQGPTTLSWDKVDAIPGWFMFQSYCVWRALLDQQA